jgi:hypothetical protein
MSILTTRLPRRALAALAALVASAALLCASAAPASADMGPGPLMDSAPNADLDIGSPCGGGRCY